MLSIKQLHPLLLRVFLLLLVINALAFALFFKYASPRLTVFPDNSPPYDWSIDTWHDPYSTINLEDSVVSISAGLKLSKEAEQPSVGVGLNFNKNPNKYVSFSDFDRIKVRLKCSIKNTMYLALSSHDEKITQPNYALTYRTAGAFIGCDTEWREVIVNLDSLEIPIWWLSMFKYKASENSYDLDKVIRVILETSYESPRDTDIKLNIARITFEGHKDGYLLYFSALSFFSWICFLIWAIKFQIKQRSPQKPVVQVLEYEQLKFDPIRDRDKQAILDYISKNFADAEIDIEVVCKVVGVSRSRVNEVLKTEFGVTFTNYINKLRLTEAARLLAEKPDAHITEIAYLIGFKNISYFNKLFKEQFGSTPKTFKNKKVDPSKES